MKPCQNIRKCFHVKKYKTNGFGTPSVRNAQILRLYKRSLERNHFKNK